MIKFHILKVNEDYKDAFTCDIRWFHISDDLLDLLWPDFDCEHVSSDYCGAS